MSWTGTSAHGHQLMLRSCCCCPSSSSRASTAARTCHQGCCPPLPWPRIVLSILLAHSWGIWGITPGCFYVIPGHDADFKSCQETGLSFMSWTGTSAHGHQLMLRSCCCCPSSSSRASTAARTWHHGCCPLPPEHLLPRLHGLDTRADYHLIQGLALHLGISWYLLSTQDNGIIEESTTRGLILSQG